MRLDPDAITLDGFVASLEGDGGVDPQHAEQVNRGVPVYSAAIVNELSVDESSSVGTPRGRLMDEWASVLLDGSGILVIADAFEPAVLDRASAVFEEIIADEKAAGNNVGDHFAKAGANDRIWNSLEKHCRWSPESFAEYYANPSVSMVAEAWLGPGYQVTAQVNVVNPGGEAQEPHRDYHLGFMSTEQAARFPAHVHRLSPALTLQGAVAHGEMPVETGPTLYLPGSQRYELGYLAWRDPEIKAYFAENHVQLPLAKGDLVFFNPALFHAAGGNRTASVRRMANLLQISSPLGRAMERIDRRAMIELLYPILQEQLAEGVPRHAVADVVAASAEGYAFPGDLDQDQPVDGLAPESDAAIVIRGLDEGLSFEQVSKAFSLRA